MYSRLKRIVLDQANMLISDVHHRFFETSGLSIPCQVDLSAWLNNEPSSEPISITSLLPQDRIEEFNAPAQGSTHELTVGIFPVYLPASLGLSVEPRMAPLIWASVARRQDPKLELTIAPQRSVRLNIPLICRLSGLENGHHALRRLEETIAEYGLSELALKRICRQLGTVSHQIDWQELTQPFRSLSWQTLKEQCNARNDAHCVNTALLMPTFECSQQEMNFVSMVQHNMNDAIIQATIAQLKMPHLDLPKTKVTGDLSERYVNIFEATFESMCIFF